MSAEKESEQLLLSELEATEIAKYLINTSQLIKIDDKVSGEKLYVPFVLPKPFQNLDGYTIVKLIYMMAEHYFQHKKIKTKYKGEEPELFFVHESCEKISRVTNKKLKNILDNVVTVLYQGHGQEGYEKIDFLNKTRLNKEIIRPHKNNNKNNKFIMKKNNKVDKKSQENSDEMEARAKRDFNSPEWKRKLANKSYGQQKHVKLRLFPQIVQAIKDALDESGEIQNEWITRAIIDRLRADHPDIYEELRSKRDEMPLTRYDARPGVDLD